LAGREQVHAAGTPGHRLANARIRERGPDQPSGLDRGQRRGMTDERVATQPFEGAHGTLGRLRPLGVVVVRAVGAETPPGAVVLVALVELGLALTIRLTRDTEAGERQGRQPALGNVEPAFLAEPVAAVVDPAERLVD